MTGVPETVFIGRDGRVVSKTPGGVSAAQLDAGIQQVVEVVRERLESMLTPELSLGALLAIFAGGLVSFFSPCVAPLAPGYIGYLSGRSVRAEATGEGS